MLPGRRPGTLGARSVAMGGAVSRRLAWVLWAVAMLGLVLVVCLEPYQEAKMRAWPPEPSS
jgi:CBS-domain-containing membrane protein